jgi:tetratricopeptide (TPR) repeat protein
MRRAFGCVLSVVLTFILCPVGVAQDAVTNANRDSCLREPVRACVLDEALIAARSAKPSPESAVQLAAIVEVQAAMGNLPGALDIAYSIPSYEASYIAQAPRVTALLAVAGAQARRDQRDDALETLIRVRQVADELKDRLGRAEALQSLSAVQLKWGMATAATETFRASLKLAESVKIRPQPPVCMLSPQQRLDALLQRLAQQQAEAGDISDALRIARSISDESPVRADVLRAIAEILARSGLKDEAELVLKEALEVVRSRISNPIWQGCRSPGNRSYSMIRYVEMLCDVAKTQAKEGLTDDAAATFSEALRVTAEIQEIRGNPLLETVTKILNADGSEFKEVVAVEGDSPRVAALTAVARAQHQVGFSTQADETFAQAAQAAAKLGDTQYHVGTLSELGRAQYEAGHTAEATRMFDSALEGARRIDNNAVRSSKLLTVLNAKIAAGLIADAEAILADVAEAARSLLPAARAPLLQAIASVQEKIGRRENALTTYREALENAIRAPSAAPIAAIEDSSGRPQETGSIAGSGHHDRLATWPLHDALFRSRTLLAIATALPE